jgi:hypothetical protein
MSRKSAFPQLLAHGRRTMLGGLLLAAGPGPIETMLAFVVRESRTTSSSSNASA